MMKNPCAKIFIWLLFSILSIPYGLGTTFAVSMYESEDDGKDDIICPESPVCLDDENGVVEVEFTTSVYFEYTPSEELFGEDESESNLTQYFMVRASVFGIDPTDDSLIPIPMYPISMPTPNYYSYSSIETSNNGNYTNFDLDFDFQLINSPAYSGLCAYTIKIEVLACSGFNCIQIGDFSPYIKPDGTPFTAYIGNLAECGAGLGCEMVYDCSSGDPSQVRFGFEKEQNAELAIRSMHPNPVSSTAILTFETQNDAVVSLIDLRGKKRTIPTIQEKFRSGIHTVKLPLDELTAGIYFVQLQSGSSLVTKKLMIID